MRADVRETDRFQLGGPQETQGQGSQEDSLGLGRGDNCTAFKQAIFNIIHPGCVLLFNRPGVAGAVL